MTTLAVSPATVGFDESVNSSGGLVLESPGIARELERQFLADVQQSKELTEPRLPSTR